MQQIIGRMKKTPVMNEKMPTYNLKYNMESITEDYYLPVRGGDSGTSIDTFHIDLVMMVLLKTLSI